MSWKIQVNVGAPGRPSWKAMRPTGGKPYEFERKENARSTMEMCYPDSIYGEDVRIVNFCEADT